MKKTNLIATTALAGALVFTGANNAHAAEELSDSQIQQKASDYINANNLQLKEGSKIAVSDENYGIDVPDGYKLVIYSEIINNSPSSMYVNKTTGDVIDPIKDHVNQSMAQNNEEQTTDSNATADNNEQQTADSNATADNNEQQTADSNVTADNNKQQTTDSNVTADNNEQQVLPETGETQSNSSLVTIFASVLLAVGSLLTFKRFSNNK